MAPVLETSALTESETFNASLAANKPSGVVEGDLMVAWVCPYQSNSISSAPSGWNAIHSGDSGNRELFAYWKEAGGSEPSTYTWSFTGTSGGTSILIVRVSGHDSASPINQQARTIYSSGTGPMVSPSVTTDVDDCLVLIADCSFPSPSTPTGTTIIDNQRNQAIFYLAGAYFTQASAGATGTKQWSSGANQFGVTSTIAITPAAGAATVEGDTTDTSEMGETITCVVTYTAQNSEGLTLSDTEQSVATLLSSVVDGSVFGETWNRVKSLFSSLSDGSVLSDTQTATALLLVSQSEGHVLSDSFVNVGTLLVDVSDQSVFSDAYAFTGTITESLTESVVLSDTGSVVLTGLGSTTEGVDSGDTHTSRCDLLTTLTEGLELSDTQTSVSGMVMVSITEGMVGGDTSTNTLQAVASLTEGTVTSDVISPTLSCLAVLSEGADFGDTFSVITVGESLAPYYYTTLLAGRFSNV